MATDYTQSCLEWGDYEPATFDENGEPVDLFTHPEDTDMRKAADLFSNEVLANRLDRLTDTLSDESAADLRARWDTVEFLGYTHGELRLAFDIVANPSDWKAPIETTIDERFLPAVTAAVHFFTSTDIVCDGRDPNHSRIQNAINIRATGYRNGPAGP